MPTLFGISLHQIDQLRARGMSFAQIGARRRVSEVTLRHEVMTVLIRTQKRAVLLRQTPPVQARRWIELQRKNLKSWLEVVPPVHHEAADHPVTHSTGPERAVERLSRAYLCHLPI